MHFLLITDQFSFHIKKCFDSPQGNMGLFFEEVKKPKTNSQASLVKPAKEKIAMIVKPASACSINMTLVSNGTCLQIVKGALTSIR